MIPPHLRNAAAKLRRQSETSDEPEKSALLLQSEEMSLYATYREEQWAKEHPKDETT
jgi:hypothetical protein